MKYKNCRILNYHRYSEHEAVCRAIRALCEEMGYKGVKRERQARVLVLDLYCCFKGDKTRYLKFYRNPNFYESVKQYNWFGISYRVVRQLVDRLHGLEYIEFKKGFKNWETGHTESSKMKAEPKLIEFLEGYGVKLKMIKIHKEELIILKEPTKKVRVDGKWKKIKRKKAYRDTKKTIEMRKVVSDFNRMLAKHHFDLDPTGYSYKRKVKEGYLNDPRKHQPLRFDLSNMTYKRVFNGNFNSGGRWYGTWVQGCPEGLRQHVRIDGEYVYEFDFSGLHIHLLYSLIGLRLCDKEPYILPKNAENSKMRRVYKLIMLTSVNCKGDDECIGAVTKQLFDEMEQESDKWPSKVPDLKKMLAELKKHHKPIKQFVNNSTGLTLQNIDSKIAELVIVKMTALNIPVICVHDSFLCKVSDAKLVHSVMKKAFIDVIMKELEQTEYELKIDLDEVLTTECMESDKQIPSYLNTTFKVANLLTSSLVLKNNYATRRLKCLLTREVSVNEVIKIHPEVEYY